MPTRRGVRLPAANRVHSQFMLIIIVIIILINLIIVLTILISAEA